MPPYATRSKHPPYNTQTHAHITVPLTRSLTHTHTHARTHARTHTHTHKRTGTQDAASTPARTRPRTHTNTQIHKYTNTQTHKHINTQAHQHSNTHTHNIQHAAHTHGCAMCVNTNCSVSCPQWEALACVWHPGACPFLNLLHANIDLNCAHHSRVRQARASKGMGVALSNFRF